MDHAGATVGCLSLGALAHRRWLAAAAPYEYTLPAEYDMSLGAILLIVLVLMLLGSFPRWGHSRSWGYGPSGGVGMVLLIVVVLVLMGRI
jgi:hypothetical protein